MSAKTYSFEGGKYEFDRIEQGLLVAARRNGKFWAQGLDFFQFAKGFHAALDEIDRLQEQAAERAEQPPECDVRKILLRVVPGDGNGEEVYAKNVREVEDLLTEMGQRIEELEGAEQPDLADTEVNEKLRALADRIDHEQLWQRPGMEIRDWPQDKRDRLEAGIQLRRYASFFGQNCWRIFPPRGSVSFRASTFEKVVEMAGGHAERLSVAPSIGEENTEGRA